MLNRQRIYERDQMRCRNCGKRGKPGQSRLHLQIHHILPCEDGGSDEDSNLILLCGKCHAENEIPLRRLRYLKLERDEWSVQAVSMNEVAALLKKLEAMLYQQERLSQMDAKIIEAEMLRDSIIAKMRDLIR